MSAPNRSTARGRPLRRPSELAWECAGVSGGVAAVIVVEVRVHVAFFGMPRRQSSCDRRESTSPVTPLILVRQRRGPVESHIRPVGRTYPRVVGQQIVD